MVKSEFLNMSRNICWSLKSPSNLFVGYLVANCVLVSVSNLDLPHNTILLDWVNFICIPIIWWYLIHKRLTVRLPLFWTVILMLSVSSMAALKSVDLSRSFWVVFKEAYLYLWFITLVTIFREYVDHKTFMKIMVVWVSICILQAIITIFQWTAILAKLSFIWDFIGNQSHPNRGIGMFKNPNLASGYFMTGIFALGLLDISSTLFYVGASLILFGGMMATGSRGCMLATVCGVCASVMFVRLKNGLYIGNFPRAIIATLIIFLAIFGSIFLISESSEFRERIEDNVEARFQPRFSMEYIKHSIVDRLGTWVAGLESISVYGPVLGVGPDGASEAVSRCNCLPSTILRPQSMHNTFIAFLVERGILGSVCLLLLVFEITNRLIVTARCVKSTDLKALSSLAGLFAGVVVFSLSHDVFHFRYFWFFGAILFGMFWKNRSQNVAEKDLY